MENDDPNITPNAYSAGQLLLDLNGPVKVSTVLGTAFLRLNGPIFNIR